MLMTYKIFWSCIHTQGIQTKWQRRSSMLKGLLEQLENTDDRELLAEMVVSLFDASLKE